jgi:peptide/nickel transport system permease protein
MLYGARSSLYVASLTVLLSVTLGVFIGLVSGYFGKTIDHIFMRLVDIVMAFPGILLAMSLAALLGPSLHTVIFSISATGWTSAARIIRSQVLSLREREYVLASKALGATHTRLILSHILPGTITPLVVHSTFALSGVIIVEASLSFLGLGAQDGALTWGGLLGQGSQIELARAPHLTLIPGAAIFLLVLSLNQMGDALRDALNPRN